MLVMSSTLVRLIKVMPLLAMLGVILLGCVAGRAEPDAAAPTPIPSVTPNETTATLLEPILTAARVLPGTWSPDSSVLAYWTFSEEEVAVDYTLPPGQLYFYDVRAGTHCPSSIQVGYRYGDPALAWLPDGRVQVITEQGAMEGTPCEDDFASANDAQSYFIDRALSPDGRHLTRTTATSDDYHYITSITAVTTGETVNTVEWEWPGRLGGVSVGGQWIANDYFLLYETLGEPLLLGVDGSVTGVASELFALPADAICQSSGCEATLMARGAALEGADVYHLILFGAGIESAFPAIRLYHSENGAVEELDFRKQAGFSPDGRNLLFYEENAANEYTLRMMPVDSAESQVYTLLTGVASPFPVAWSPDSAELAVGSDGRLQSFSTGTGNVARAWDTGRWRVMPVAWSPDGRYLTLQGVNLSEQEEALFVVDTLQ